MYSASVCGFLCLRIKTCRHYSRKRPLNSGENLTVYSADSEVSWVCCQLLGCHTGMTYWAVRLAFLQWDLFCTLNVVPWWWSWSPLVTKEKNGINSMSSLLDDLNILKFKQRFSLCPQNSIPAKKQRCVVNVSRCPRVAKAYPTCSLPLDKSRNVTAPTDFSPHSPDWLRRFWENIFQWKIRHFS